MSRIRDGPMLNAIDAYLSRSSRVLSVVVVAALTGMLLVNAASVGLRSVGLGSIHWAHEISIVLALGVYFLSYGIVIRRGAEIRVEFLSSRLPETVRLALETAGQLIQLVLYLYVGLLAYQYANRVSLLPMPMTRMSQAWVFAPLVVGFVDSSLVIVLKFLIRGQKGPPPEQTKEMV